MAERNIVDIGKFLQRYGLNIGEHPKFGGVGKGHSPTGYHPTGEAIDVRDWRPDVAPAHAGGKPISWKQRTGELSWRAKQLGLFNEALGPGDKGHDTHVHLALQGNRYITDPQLEWLATGRYRTPEGKLTDVMPGAVAPTAQQESTPVDTQGLLSGYLLGSLLRGEPKEDPKTQMMRGFVKELVQPQQNDMAGALFQQLLSSSTGGLFV